MTEPDGATVPELSDTDDLRSGPEINPVLLAVLPLVGSWVGHGSGLTPADQREFSYAQRITLSHDGRPFLSYASHTWLLDADGSVLRPAFRESGFLRVGPGENDLELVLATAAGIVEVFTGVAGEQRWELASGAVGFTPTAKQIAGERRLYALVDETLAYVQELAIVPEEFRPHLNARLTRISVAGVTV
ncbi:MAG TPA: FABP family protein [Jatrophihabitans sp.]|jgi:hypothetical protein